MSELVPVKTYLDRTSAEVARGLLESNGIQAIVAGDDEGAMGPNLAFANGIRILVPQEKANEAKELLEQDHSADSDA